MFPTLKYLVAIALYLLVGNIFASNEAPAPTEMQKLITGEQTLKVGHLAYPPFYEIIDGKLMGMDAEIVREAAKRAQIKKLVLVTYNSIPELTTALDTGEITLIVSGFLKTPERQQTYLLTIPYYKGGGVGFLYSKDQPGFKTAKDLQGYRIGVLQYSYPDRFWLPQQGISRQKITVYPTVQSLLLGLKNKEIDVIVNNYTFCRYYAAMDKQLIAYLAQPMGIAFMMRKQDNALQQSLNAALLSMWKDGSLYAIKAKYLVPIDIQPQKHYSP